VVKGHLNLLTLRKKCYSQKKIRENHKKIWLQSVATDMIGVPMGVLGEYIPLKFIWASFSATRCITF